MKKSWKKKVIVSGLALSMLMGTGTAAFAKEHDGKEDGNRRENYSNQGKRSIKVDFDDLKGMDWAMRYIADLASRRVFDGYSDGTFRPQDTVTRIEAITAAVRVMGLRDLAESSAEMQMHLNFKDAAQVPAWATGYVAVAVENNLFAETDNLVNPNQPADRLWATTLLVKALKLDKEAISKMNSKLSYSDANKIPAGSVGYVQVATEKGLVNGFEDNTFRPNQPVSRAQIAALLSRAGDQLPGSTDGLVTGTVATVVNNNALSITNRGNTLNIMVDPNVFVYRNGAKVSVSALQVGDVVKTRSYNNIIIFIEVTQPANTVPIDNNGVTTGTITMPIRNNVLTITNASQTIDLTLASNVYIYRNGTQVNAPALQVGDVINIRTYNNSVFFIQVTQTSGTQPTDSSTVLSGTVASAVNNNLLSIINSSQTLSSLTLNANAFIYRNGGQVGASDLRAGDVITLHHYNNVVLFAEVTQLAGGGTSAPPNISTSSGTLTTLANSNVLRMTNGGQTVTLALNSNAFILRGGVLVRATALQPGDVLNVRSYNNVVFFAEVTQPLSGTNFFAVGTLNNWTLNNQGKISEISINQVNYNGSSQTTVYSVSPTVTINGDLSKLMQNQAIQLQGSNQLITTIWIQ